MTRRRIIAKEKKYRCPVCPKQAFKKRYIAQHLAMSQDKNHIRWRMDHGLPKQCGTMREVAAITPKIIKILQER